MTIYAAEPNSPTAHALTPARLLGSHHARAEHHRRGHPPARV